MSGDESHIAEAEQAIAHAEEMLSDLAPTKKSKVRRRTAALTRRVPPPKRWWLPVGILAFLFVVQALVAALAEGGTVGSIFAVGAVLVAILTAVVAVLSYAQQASVPFADIVKILDALLKALEALKAAQKEPSDEEDLGTGEEQGAGLGGEATTEVVDSQTSEIHPPDR